MMATARPAAAGQAVFVVIAFAILTTAFMLKDFSVAYVAQNSNAALPWYYRFSAVWGAHEGSKLLWIMILSLWTVAVAAFSRRLPDVFVSRVIGVLGFGQLRLPAVRAVHVESVPAPRAGTARRQRSESAAARLRA